ncbi:MAG: hypothetical protein HUJ31_16115, partial [Pseudomonadales bacterium]|nr:hypothetical protein [Pseudomonadales bacterium]
MVSRAPVWLALGLALLVAGCASRPPVPVGDVIQSEAWGFTGKLGVRTDTESANLGVQ